MPVGKPDEYKHNNPDDAFVDSNFVRGGGRVVADLTALYALAANADQLKQNATIVHVTDIGDGTSRKYELVNTTDLTAGAFNPTAWKQLQPIGTTDSPTFAGMALTGINPLVINKSTNTSDAPIIATQVGIPDFTEIEVLRTGIKNTDGNTVNWKFMGASVASGNPSYDVVLYLPQYTGGYLALTSDIAAAVSAGNHYRGTFASLSALQTAIPTGNAGDYADILGSPTDQRYIWDTDHSEWAVSTITPAGTFSALSGSPSDNTALASALAAKVDVVAGYGLISTADQTAISTNTTAITTEATTRASADTTLQNNINTNTTAIALKDNAAIGFNDQTGTAYTVVLTDASKKIRMNNSAANTVTIPLNANVAFPVGSYFYVSMQGTGTTTIVGASGVTVQGITTAIDVQYNEALVWKEATDTWKVTGIIPNISATDGPNASIKNIPGTNTIDFNAKVLQAAGLGGCLNFSANNLQYATVPTAGLSGDFSVTIIFKTTQTNGGLFTVGAGNIANGGTQNNTGLSFSSTTIYPNSHNNSGTTYTKTINDGNWHLLILVYQSGTGLTTYLDNVTLGTDLTNSLNPTNILLGWSANDGNQRYFSGKISQFLYYSSILSGPDRTAIWNGGSFTSTPPTINLQRSYQFQDGTGTVASDNSSNNLNAPLSNNPLWLGPGNGVVPQGSTTTDCKYMEVIDGVIAGERGQVKSGDVLCGNVQQGRSYKNFINNFYCWIQDFSGKVLLNPTNSSTNSVAASTFDIAGNITIGASYASINVAPANGALIQGRAVLGNVTDNLTDQLQVAGNIALIGVGSKVKITTGTNASIGTATLSAGTVTVNTTAITATGLIFLTCSVASGTIGILSIGTKTAGSSFIINSSSISDTSTINWWIIN